MKNLYLFWKTKLYFTIASTPYPHHAHPHCCALPCCRILPCGTPCPITLPCIHTPPPYSVSCSAPAADVVPIVFYCINAVSRSPGVWQCQTIAWLQLPTSPSISSWTTPLPSSSLTQPQSHSHSAMWYTVGAAMNAGQRVQECDTKDECCWVIKKQSDICSAVALDPVTHRWGHFWCCEFFWWYSLGSGVIKGNRFVIWVYLMEQ